MEYTHTLSQNEQLPFFVLLVFCLLFCTVCQCVSSQYDFPEGCCFRRPHGSSAALADIASNSVEAPLWAAFPLGLLIPFPWGFPALCGILSAFLPT